MVFIVNGQPCIYNEMPLKGTNSHYMKFTPYNYFLVYHVHHVWSVVNSFVPNQTYTVDQSGLSIQSLPANAHSIQNRRFCAL